MQAYLVSRKFQITWKTLLLPAVGLLAFLLYLYIFNVDIPKMVAIIQSVDLTIYSLAVIALILETFLFTLSWRCLLNFLSVKLTVVKSFLYVWYGIFMDIVIPAESISGEISRIYLITREQNGTSGKVVASLVAHRLMGTGMTIASLLTGMIVLLLQKQIGGIVLNLTLFLIIVTTIFLVLLILLCIKERWTLQIIDIVIRLVRYISRGRWKLDNVRRKIVKAAETFHNSMKEFGHAPKTLITSLCLSFFSWFCSVAVIYLVFLSMGFSIRWSVIIVTSSIIVAIRSIPLGVPFEAGLPELTMPTLYAALLTEIPVDIRITICATATILIRILTMWLRFFIGFVVLQWLGIKTVTTSSFNSEKLMSETKKT